MINLVAVVFFVMIQKSFSSVKEDKTFCNGRSGGCCAGFIYDSKRNECVECPIGFVGNVCEKPCPYPLFGNSCRDRCNCSEKECNNVDGCGQRNTTEKNFFITDESAERTTPLIPFGNVGNNTFHKMNLSSLQRDTEQYIDNQLSILTSENGIQAPIRISIIILACVSAIILVLYFASYRNFLLQKIECVIGVQTN